MEEKSITTTHFLASYVWISDYLFFGPLITMHQIIFWVALVPWAKPWITKQLNWKAAIEMIRVSVNINRVSFSNYVKVKGLVGN